MGSKRGRLLRSCTVAVVGSSGKRLSHQVLEANAQALAPAVPAVPASRPQRPHVGLKS